MTSGQERLDAFTDAAFAFAVTLMVAGTGGMAPDYRQLEAAIAGAPSFAIAFAIIAMFWLAHVRARRMVGNGDWRFMLLTLALVFTVLLYVHPLRAMASSFAAFVTGNANDYGGRLGQMFALYGAGFILMSLLTAGLFATARRNPDLDAAGHRVAHGQTIIWLLLVVTGLLSTIMTFFRATVPFAPMIYATLPLTIGIFASRYRWYEPAAAATEQEQT
ncbi:MAG: DUF1211 domain-containing protein [Sphingopyxis sp.]|nr:DUF1211 domain-containing protein [Sphingopyxis sp.]